MKLRNLTVASALFALAAGWAVPRPLAAQTVEGRVVDLATGVGLPGVHLRLLDGEGRAAASDISDDSGSFHITAPAPGRWRIAGELVGYGTARSDFLVLEDEGWVRLEIRMAVAPVEIDEAVLVVAERAHGSPDLTDFHRRRAQSERGGFGYFIFGDALDRASGLPTSVLRTVPGVSIHSARRGRIVRMRGGCIPAVYLDGVHLNSFNLAESLDTYVDIQSIEGMEVYRGAQQPGGRFFDRAGCGLVLVWTRHGSNDPEEPLDWTRVGLGLGLLLGLVGLTLF